MKSFVLRQSLAVSCRKIKFCLLLMACCLLPACSMPNLEKPECTAARQTVKEFYSFHFGNDMRMSPENLRQRERFLSGDLKKNLLAQPESQTDYFTRTEDYPKAFRIGECEVVNENKTDFQVVLFWKNDERNEQREVKVEAVKENEKWLIDKVF